MWKSGEKPALCRNCDATLMSLSQIFVVILYPIPEQELAVLPPPNHI